MNDEINIDLFSIKIDNNLCVNTNIPLKKYNLFYNNVKLYNTNNKNLAFFVKNSDLLLCFISKPKIKSIEFIDETKNILKINIEMINVTTDSIMEYSLLCDWKRYLNEK